MNLMSSMAKTFVGSVMAIVSGRPARDSGTGRDFFVLDEAKLNQSQAELSPVLALIVQRLLELFSRDALLFEKQLSDAYRHLDSVTCGCGWPGLPGHSNPAG